MGQLSVFRLSGLVLAIGSFLAASLRAEDTVILPKGKEVKIGRNIVVPVGAVAAGMRRKVLIDITDIQVSLKPSDSRGATSKDPPLEGGKAGKPDEGTEEPEEPVEITARRIDGPKVSIKTTKNFPGGEVYTLSYREKFQVQTYTRIGRSLIWRDTGAEFQDRRIEVIVPLSETLAEVRLEPGQKTSLDLPGKIKLTGVLNESKLADAVIAKSNEVEVTARSPGKAVFRLEYLLGGKTFHARLPVEILEAKKEKNEKKPEKGKP